MFVVKYLQELQLILHVIYNYNVYFMKESVATFKIFLILVHFYELLFSFWL